MSELSSFLTSAAGLTEISRLVQQPLALKSLKLHEQLREKYGPELAAALLTQAELQLRAELKFGANASRPLLYTRTGLEQASRPVASAWRVAQLCRLGVTHLIDLGCGLGFDSLAAIRAGITVTAVELDSQTAEFAAWNLGQPVIQGDVTELAKSLIAQAGKHIAQAGQAIAQAGQNCNANASVAKPAKVAIFLDPARRTGTGSNDGRTWRIDQISPNWEFVMELFAGPHLVNVKLGPGVPYSWLPATGETYWLSDAGDTIEASLWNQPLGLSTFSDYLDDSSQELSGGFGQKPVGGANQRFAVNLDVIPGTGTNPPIHASVENYREPVNMAIISAGLEPQVGELQQYLFEPLGAALRAGASGVLASQLSAWVVHSGIGYLTGNQLPQASLRSWLKTYRIDQVLPFDLATLKQWVKANQIGTITIKKRGVEIDPAKLRKQVKLKGSNAATLVITPTLDGVRALVVTPIAY